MCDTIHLLVCNFYYYYYYHYYYYYFNICLITQFSFSE